MLSIKKYKNIKIVNHPLFTDKMATLRNKYTSLGDFRSTIKDISMFLCYETMKDVPTIKQKIVTPLEATIQNVIASNKICLVPILRAGLAMSEGFLELLPRAKVGHLGLYRDPKTHKPVEYFCKLPKDIKNLNVYLLDPMFATGGSAIDAVNTLKKHGVKNITFVCMVAAPEGVIAFRKKFKDVPIVIGVLDRQLNKNKYILPGIGDAGDRIFGTED